jgi:predicted nucleic acid-binding protein
MAAVVLDAGPLVAMLDRREKFHSWATKQTMGLSEPLLTCDAVLTEAFFLVSRAETACAHLRDYLRKGLIVSNFSAAPHLETILHLMERYSNVPMSFADACLVCMVENNPGSTLFTLDRDFAIYRQQRRRLIPLIAPF